MAIIRPLPLVQASDAPTVYYYLQTPPVSWPTVASEWDRESGTSVDGRYKAHHDGAVTGRAKRKNGQNTFTSDTSGVNGTAFTVTAGTVKGGLLNPDTDTTGLWNTDYSQEWRIDSVKTFATLPAADTLLKMSLLPSDSDNLRYLPTVVYVEYGSNSANGSGYRVVFPYNAPPRLEYKNPTGGNYLPIATWNNVGNIDQYLQGNHQQVNIRWEPDYNTGTMYVEVGDGGFMRHSPVGILAPGEKTLLPQGGMISAGGFGRIVGFWFQPLVYQPVTVRKAGVNLTPPNGLPPTSAPYAVGNGLTRTTPAQSNLVSVNWESGNPYALEWQALASNPDDGSGEGSSDPPKLTDVTIIIPETWTQVIDNGSPVIIWPSWTALQTMRISEHCMMDDTTREMSYTASVTLNNFNMAYSGAIGTAAINIAASIDGGSTLWQRCRGYGGMGQPGVLFTRDDPMMTMRIDVYDRSAGLKVSAGYERLYDGWCLFSAVRFEARIGNVHPDFLQNIPYWPDGPADDTCPYPILARGTGLSPKYRFGPESTPHSVIQMLAQDAGMPISTGVSLPYYFGFDPYGNFHFEPYDPWNFQNTAVFTTTPQPGCIVITGPLVLSNSSADMRSEVNFQGIDAWTGQLMQAHLQTSTVTRNTIGVRNVWLERNARYSSQDFLWAIAQTGAGVASLPTIRAEFDCPYTPYLFAGQTCLIYESRLLGGYSRFVINEVSGDLGLASLSGEGHQVATMHVIARNIEAYPGAGVATPGTGTGPVPYTGGF